MSGIKPVSPFISSGGREVDVRVAAQAFEPDQPFNILDLSNILDIPLQDGLNAIEALIHHSWIEVNTRESTMATNKAWVFKGQYEPEELVQLEPINKMYGGNRPVMPRTEAEKFLKANANYQIIWEFAKQDSQKQ